LLKALQAELVAIVQTLSAAGQLLETAIRILRRLANAYKYQKELARTLDQYRSELESVKGIIGILEDEETLQTASVNSEVLRLKDIEDKLVQHLKQFDTAPRGTIKEFAHQFMHGSSDEKKLGTIMNDLSHVKTALLLCIQLASVGVMRTVENNLVANADAINRIDRFLKDELGEEVGLKIARLLKGRRPSSMCHREDYEIRD
jgi:hypothetical protein